MYRLLQLVSLFAVAVMCATASASAPMLKFKLFDSTGLPLGQVLWTGHKFLYVAEHTGTIKVSDAHGKTVSDFTKFPQRGDEMRCAGSLSVRHHWAAGLFCHTPDNRIMHVSPNGDAVTLFAKLPAEAGPTSDGGIAFDNVGRFGYRLLVSSGGSTSDGGSIYAFNPDGTEFPIGQYPGPGGADNIVVAPSTFGAAAGSILIAIDQEHVSGRVLAMNRRGQVTVVASNLANGVNGITIIHRSPRHRPAASALPGFYVGDYNSGNVYYAPAAALQAYVGDLIVSGEEHAWFWVVRPHGNAFRATRVATNLPTKDWSIEGTTYVP